MSGSAWIDDLLGPEGQRLLDELTRQSLAPDLEIALITKLRRTYPQELVAAAVEQAKLRERARGKFTLADRMYFTRAGLEQASSERMARHHSSRYAGFQHVADLCTGIGGDAIGLADRRAVLGVDKDEVHAQIAQVNAYVNDVGDLVSTCCADVRDVLLDGIPAAFVDPARRSGDRRMPAGTSEPPLSWCFALAERGIATGIKAAPGLPTDLVPPGWELEFVSEDRELKESLLWSPSLAGAVRRATVLPEGHTMVARGGVTLPVQEPGAYLIDPDPAITRAGLVEELGQSLGDWWKIDDRIAFLSSNAEAATPFGRTLRVEASMPWSLARLRDALRGLGVGVVDIRKRGSAVDVDELSRRLKLTGDRSATVVLTRASDRPWAMVCFDIPSTRLT